jgi:hypothetical protein
MSSDGTARDRRAAGRRQRAGASDDASATNVDGRGGQLHDVLRAAASAATVGAAVGAARLVAAPWRTHPGRAGRPARTSR